MSVPLVIDEARNFEKSTLTAVSVLLYLYCMADLDIHKDTIGKSPSNLSAYTHLLTWAEIIFNNFVW